MIGKLYVLSLYYIMYENPQASNTYFLMPFLWTQK